MMKPSVERFTETVENYIKYRPSYPKEILSLLINECKLTHKKIIADIGSGTGLLTKLFLSFVDHVYGVEPNQAMRLAAEKLLSTFPNFQSVNGQAEKTNLPHQSVNLITVGTAFHWFDDYQCKKEFKRILKPPGYVALVWNVRDKEKSKLVNEYETLLLKYCKDYQVVVAKKFNKTVVEEFFSPFQMKEYAMQNIQNLTWLGFKGRLLSSSFSLRFGDSGYDEMIKELKSIFDKYQSNGEIAFLYRTSLYCGQLC